MTLDDLRRAGLGDDAALAQLDAALKRGDKGEVAAASQLTPAETARLVLELKPQRARDLLLHLPDAPNLAALHELDPSIQARLLDETAQARLARIIAGMDVDTAAGFLVNLPAPVVDAALAGHAHAAAIRQALSHCAETAGAIMSRQFVAVPREWTVSQVIDEIRTRSDEVERLNAVYVLDDRRRLVGYLKLRDLLLQPADAVVSGIMRSDTAAVSADADREEVVRVADRDRLPVVPVVDPAGVLVGQVTTEEIRAIDRAETAEDLKALSSVAPDSDEADGPVTILRRRFPWLASALIGAAGAGLIVGAYEEALEEAVILASLIPMVMDMAGNAGIQTSTVTIEAMAEGSFWRGDLKGRIMRELGGSLLNGASVGLVTAIGILGLSTLFEIHAPGRLALTAAATLVLIIMQASLVGVVVPVLLRRMKFDPAVGTGVFITTVNDFAGIMILFLVAKALYLPYL